MSLKQLCLEKIILNKIPIDTLPINLQETIQNMEKWFPPPKLKSSKVSNLPYYFESPESNFYVRECWGSRKHI